LVPDGVDATELAAAVGGDRALDLDTRRSEHGGKLLKLLTVEEELTGSGGVAGRSLVHANSDLLCTDARDVARLFPHDVALEECNLEIARPLQVGPVDVDRHVVQSRPFHSPNECTDRPMVPSPYEHDVDMVLAAIAPMFCAKEAAAAPLDDRAFSGTL
jgi:hypothetical protein